MLADIQRTVYPEEVTRQLHVMAQGRGSLFEVKAKGQYWPLTCNTNHNSLSSPTIDRRSNHCATPLTPQHYTEITVTR